MIVVGADPGLDGAIVALDTASGALYVQEMPTTKTARKSKGDKRVIDLPALYLAFEGCKLLGVTHFIVEEVGGLPGQSASGAFAFGFGAGALRMAAVAVGLAIEPVTPQRWKSAMRVGTDPEAIRARATEVFPHHAHLWARPPRSPSKKSEVGLGRAEAALIAAYGARVLGNGAA
jgi:hypothetical protein